MPAPMPLEPPVTIATLPLNDFVCIWPPKPPGHPLCHIMDCSVQNEHSAGAAHIRANGWNDEIICIGNLCPAPGKTMETRAWFISGFPSGISPAKSASRQRPLLAAKLHEAYNSLQVQLPDLQDAGQSTLTGRS